MRSLYLECCGQHGTSAYNSLYSSFKVSERYISLILWHFRSFGIVSGRLEKKYKRMRRKSLDKIINLVIRENKNTPPMIHFSRKILLMSITKCAIWGPKTAILGHLFNSRTSGNWIITQFSDTVRLQFTDTVVFECNISRDLPKQFSKGGGEEGGSDLPPLHQSSHASSQPNPILSSTFPSMHPLS